MKFRSFIILVFCTVAPLNAKFNKKTVSVMRMPSTKYNSNARLKITSPQILKRKAPILVLVSNFPIGVDVKSRPFRDLGVPENDSGSRILLIFSNGKRVYVTKDDVNLLLTQRSYFNKRFRITIPGYVYNEIENTNFLIYSMLVNSYGEAIKNENAFYTDVYCYGGVKHDNREIKKNLTKPFIVYNEPFGKVNEGPILLDYYVKNAAISSDGYKVDLYIDDMKIARMFKWDPYVIQNLSKGKHNIRIELINPSGKVEKNPISINSATIYVK